MATTFHGFTRLPAELRLAIWQMAVPASDHPEIYFACRDDFDLPDLPYDGWGDSDDEEAMGGPWEYDALDESSEEDEESSSDEDDSDESSADGDLGIGGANGEGENNSDDEWVDAAVLEPKVTIPFPALMHVSREARAAALSALAFREDVAPDGKPIQIPYRDFDPTIDVFFVNAINMPFVIAAICSAKDEWHMEIRHLALQSLCLARRIGDLLELIAIGFRDLKKISIVFGPSYHDGSHNDYGMDEDADPEPIKHFRLAPWGKAKGCIVDGDLSTNQNIKRMFKEIEESMVLMEVCDESPYDPNGKQGEGAWTFKFEAAKLQRVPPYGLPTARR
ncbi:hypothetical protein GQ53DRAFT_3212 [Thozetella sp. PMI_491]|nr:hypothetical protein GQ53DRAFT_3212 [Thozetella sp. PMI_491]